MKLNNSNLEIIIEIDSITFTKDFSDFEEEFRCWCNKKNIINPQISDFENFLDERDFDNFSIIS